MGEVFSGGGAAPNQEPSNKELKQGYLTIHK